MSKHSQIHPYGTWIAAYPSIESLVLLKKLQLDLKIPNPVNNLHCTIMSSRIPVLDAMNINQNTQSSICADVKWLEIWRKGRYNNLVIVLKSDQLVKLNKTFVNNFSVDVIEKFIPHITLSYDAGEISLPNLEKMQMIFNSVKAAPI